MNLIPHPTGASIIHAPAADANKVFFIAFRTPPTDDSGAAHAVEHCVLRGSRAYPADDPFGELARGSLHTYLNAITYPDRTVYPAASLFGAAFERILDVYADAVFNPLLTEEAFRQEVFDRRTGKGVIHSEMSAFFAAPSERLKREAFRRLFRGSCAEHAAAGTPEGVAGLNYADFAAFRKRHYTPDNCLIYLYGDMDVDSVMAALDPYLYEAAHKNPGSAFGAGLAELYAQSPPKSEPSRETLYADNLREPCGGVFFRIPRGGAAAAETLAALEIVKRCLFNAASPFRAALAERFPNAAIEPFFQDDLREAVFGVILRGCEAGGEDVYGAVMSALTRFLKNAGADNLRFSAAEYRFALAENKTGYKPAGLALGLKVLSSVLYGGGLFDRFTDDAAERFLAMPPAKLAEYITDFAEKRLLSGNGTALAMLPAKTPAPTFSFPRLSAEREEIRPAFVPVEYDAGGEIPVLRHSADTGGIAYMSALFDISALPAPLRPYAAIAARALADDAARDASLRNAYGGITIETTVFPKENAGEFAAFFAIRAKSLTTGAEEFCEHVRRLTDTRFTDTQALRHVLTEALAQAKAASRKPEAAARRSLAMFLPCAAFDENINGRDYANTLGDILSDFDARFEQTATRLNEVMAFLPRNTALFSVAGTGAQNLNTRGFSRAQSMPPTDVRLTPKDESPPRNVLSNLAASLPLNGTAGSAALIARLIENRFMAEEIRLAGGAYGVGCEISREAAVLTAFDDPAPRRSLEKFREIPRFISGLSDTDIAASRPDALNALLRPLCAEEQIELSLKRFLLHFDDKTLKKYVDEIFSASKADAAKYAEPFEIGLNKGFFAVFPLA